jgi:hypothetical protein
LTEREKSFCFHFKRFLTNELILLYIKGRRFDSPSTAKYINISIYCCLIIR